MNKETAMQRMVTARREMIFDEPFFAALALRLQLVEDPTCKTAWVDGVSLGFNPQFVDVQTPAELRGLYIHEVMHVSNGHPWRRPAHLDHETWNEACDYAINPVIVKSGYKIPADGLMDDQYDKRSAEWIGARLNAKKKQEQQQGGSQNQQNQQGQQSQQQQNGGSQGQQPQQQQGQQPGKGQGQSQQQGQGNQPGQGQSQQQGAGQQPGQGQGQGQGQQGQGNQPGQGQGQGQQQGNGTPAGAGQQGQGRSGTPSQGSPGGFSHAGEVRDAPRAADGSVDTASESEWQLAVQQAAQAAKGRGKLPAGLKRNIKEVQRARADLRAVMLRFMQAITNADFSWSRPNARYVPGGMYMPALNAPSLGTVVFGMDTSGSIDEVMIAEFAAIANHVVDDMRPKRVHIMWCDARVHSVDTFEQGEVVEFKPKGGGGTDFRPVFDKCEELDEIPACVVYLTDMDGRFPEYSNVPTLWVSSERKHREPPFGEVVVME